MKLKYFFFLSILIISSCSSDDDFRENSRKLISYQAAQLYYEYLEDNLFGIPNSYNLNFDEILLDYDNQNRIISVKGGPLAFPSGPNGQDWIMFSDVVYNISYFGDTVTTSSAVTSFYGETTNEYKISRSKIVSRSVIFPVGLIYDIVHFTYEYGNNIVFEYRNNQLHRTFYFENDNLVKVEELQYINFGNPIDAPDTLIGKFEIIFSEYDDLPNLLEGKFFLDGAFFKAFSKNNYHKIGHVQYSFNQDTQDFELYGIINWRSFNFGSNTDDVSGLFTTDCNN
jgi:hypothetical protein